MGFVNDQRLASTISWILKRWSDQAATENICRHGQKVKETLNASIKRRQLDSHVLAALPPTTVSSTSHLLAFKSRPKITSSS